MLCYRCGTHVPDTSEKCPTCGQNLTTGGLRQATGTFSRRRASTNVVEGAPYKPQDLVANRYLIKDTVGAGPLGFVFRAHDKELDVEVALKTINANLIQSADERKHFAAQIHQVRKLSHPNLARVYEDGEDGERPYFTSQFLDGLSLRKIVDLRLQKGQFFSLAEIEPILSQVCAALDGAHKVGPHSDLKPENVLVLPDLLKVTDVGLGLALPRLPFVQALKARKADRYLAPELVEGTEIDLRADIYSVGVILGEMLSGLTPDSGVVPELQRRNPEVPTALEGIYRKATNQNPNARFATAAELMAELSELTAKLTPPPPRASAPEPASGVAAPRRTTTGMLQMGPRPPPLAVAVAPLAPPVVETPPPPPPTTAENLLPDLTQPIDPEQLERALRDENFVFKSATDGKRDRDEAEVINSGVYEIDEERVPTVSRSLAELSSRPQKKKLLLALILTIVGVGVGAGAGVGFVLISRQRAQVAQKAAELEAEAARRAEMLRTAEIAAAEALAAQKLADEKAAAEKAAAERLAAERAAKEAAAKESASKEPKPLAPKPDAAAVAVAPPASGPCPEGMRPVGAGAFKMGTPAGDPMMGFDEKTLASVEVAAFCIDTFEFPNKRGSVPTASIGFADAKRLCEAQQKRLCTEAEWEKACKGPGGAKWPYGNGFDAESCNTEDDAGDARSVAPSGRFSKCRSGYGVADMSGNVAEWTAERLIKGGSFASGDYAVRCSARKNGASFARSSEVGFRCCSEQR